MNTVEAILNALWHIIAGMRAQKMPKLTTLHVCPYIHKRMELFLAGKVLILVHQQSLTFSWTVSIVKVVSRTHIIKQQQNVLRQTKFHLEEILYQVLINATQQIMPINVIFSFQQRLNLSPLILLVNAHLMEIMAIVTKFWAHRSIWMLHNQ